MNTVTLVYLLAGILQSEPQPDMPTCIINMQNLPFVERARARCQTQGIIVHWKDVRDVYPMDYSAEGAV